ncbi:dihydropteroate synthase [Nonlabens spongiae]|uniref:Dihydropteroate synthase n=1 Tax=Nonlabens spongiae TaxID=331648 RepID=A0A1W6MPL1_9FLAO|nr:dihydropteroate synthase [Nonlabens spongiae]ARN79507.1 dihydropteroate synthase [Nonlabens spongiae]
MSSLNINGKLLDLQIPVVMGIINCTPDSFYDGGATLTVDHALRQTEKMIHEGAKIIDVGGYSSRPDGQDISVEEEKSRVLPVIEAIAKRFEVGLSCDSFRESVITQALSHGANIVNDISAGKLDEEMLETVGSAQVPYIMMHMRGTPQTMKSLTNYENLITDINLYFSKRIAAARSHGINDIVIDAGFGFAKTVEQNYELLKKMNLLKAHDVPILAGLSRKSMIYKTLGIEAKDALNGTTALHMVALQKGASILRVHDVKEAVETIQLFQALQKYA